MSHASEIPVFTTEHFTAERKKYEESAKEFARRAERGDYRMLPPNAMPQGDIAQVTLNLIKGAGETILGPAENKANIVLGRDRPGLLNSGYGKDAQYADAIDLVVGRMSSQTCCGVGVGSPDFIRTPGSESRLLFEQMSPVEKGPWINPSFKADGARIYISNMTDIDKNFGLAEGMQGSSVAFSGIAIKADATRIIGRQGIKLVTGRMQGSPVEFNARGGHIPNVSPIELIAGNNTNSREIKGNPVGHVDPETVEALQPLLKGNATVDALVELSAFVEKLTGVVTNMSLLQTQFAGVLGITPVYPTAASAPTTAMTYMTEVTTPLYQLRINKILWKINYLDTWGPKYICSKNVYST